MTNAPIILPEACPYPGQVKFEAGDGVDLDSVRGKYCDAIGCALRLGCQLYAEPSQYSHQRVSYLLPCHDLVESVNSTVTDKVIMAEGVTKPRLGERCKTCLLDQAGLVAKAGPVVIGAGEGQPVLTCEVRDNRNGKFSRVRGNIIKFRPSMLLFTSGSES